MKLNKRAVLLLLISLVVILAIVIFGFRRHIISRISGGNTLTELPGNSGSIGLAPNSLFFNLETDDTVNFNKNELFHGKAHSGKFSAKAFGQNSYSYSINRNVSDVGLENMKTVAISAWIYIFPDDDIVEASMVFTAFNNNVNINWQGIPLHGKDLPQGKWFKISGKFDLSKVSLTNESRFQIYFWNNSPTDILIDDIYVTFGEPTERKGDTTYSDLTNGVFSARLNYPPFPFSFFEKENIHIGNLPLHDENSRIFTGNFLSDKSDDILILGDKVTAGIYSWCPKNGFNKTAKIPEQINNSKDIRFGKFTATGNHVLIRNNDGYILYEIKKSDNPCKNALTASYKEIWSGKNESFSTAKQFISGDIDGDGISEIIGVNKDGGFFVSRYNAGGWKETNTSVPNWLKYTPNMEIKITSAKFLQQYPYDLILVVYSEKTGGKSGYNLLKYKGGVFVSCFKNGIGKTIGADTLKITDLFIITGNFNNNGTSILKYNREWRYDLKEIVFNDSSFHVLSNIDFYGYYADRNPKYYESLKIFPLNYLQNKKTSLLLIQRNKNSKLLPDTVGIYTYKNQNKN